MVSKKVTYEGVSWMVMVNSKVVNKYDVLVKYKAPREAPQALKDADVTLEKAKRSSGSGGADAPAQKKRKS